jgi:hypothetical protein
VSRTADRGDALLRWTYRQRRWIRGVGLALLALGVLLVVTAAATGEPVVGPVFATVAWASQVVAWGWFAPALGRTRVEVEDT